MARIRTIKPEFFRHEELYEAEKESKLPLRVAFAGLWTVADREGRFKWKPKQMKFDVLPWDDVDFNDVLDVLCSYGFIQKYTVDENDYGFIPSFADHQVINNKESKSKLPPPPKIDLGKDASFTRANASQGEGKGKEGKGKEHTQVAEAVCVIFGKEYMHPEQRLPATANWYRTIDFQVKQILQVWSPDTAVRQIQAYTAHCKKTNRKTIATDYKVAETILSVDWIAISAPEQVPKEKPFAEAEYNRTLWTDQAWRDTYKHQISSNSDFRKHFNIQP